MPERWMWEHWKRGALNKGKLVGFGIGWDTPLNLPTTPGIYKIVVDGRPYIGVAQDMYARWYQHRAEAKKNTKKIFYKKLKEALDKNEVMFYIVFETNTRNGLEQFESLEIVKHNAFLNGWNQQISNEFPSQTINKYILDYEMLRDEELYDQIEWKIENTNLSHSSKSELRRKLHKARYK